MSGHTPRFEYALKDTWREKQSQPVYCVCFNNIDPASRSLFATCGGRRATIYDCLPGGAIQAVQGYMDESEDEELFAVRWSFDRTTSPCTPLLLIGGKLGVMRVLDCHDQSLLWTAVGHGGAINDIAVHPSRPELVLTASKDTSMRLWNWKAQVCVLVVNGEGGHSNEVLSIDFNPCDCTRFVSGSLDDTVKIWWLQGSEPTIAAAEKYDSSCGVAFKTGCLSLPIFSSNQVHGNYVDCVRWLGNLILSKSVDDRVLLWRPQVDASRGAAANSNTRLDQRGSVHLLQEFNMKHADIWFLRFSMDPLCRLLACGSRLGGIYLWDLMAEKDAGTAKAVLQISGGKENAVRQTAISADCRIILATCDDACIHRFDAAS